VEEALRTKAKIFNDYDWSDSEYGGHAFYSYNAVVLRRVSTTLHYYGGSTIMHSTRSPYYHRDYVSLVTTTMTPRLSLFAPAPTS
jgi:hypothetical protein